MLDTSKKSQYHSALVANSPLKARVLNEPRESKYRKQGESGHLYVKLEVDGYEFSYGAENEACAHPFEGKQGQDVTIVATGRGADAKISLNGQQSADSSSRDSSSARPDSKRVSTPRPEHQNDSSVTLEDSLAQICNAQFLIFEAQKNKWENMAINGLVPEFTSLVGNAHFQADCSIAWGKINGLGLVESLSTKPAWKEAKKSVLPSQEDEF